MGPSGSDNHDSSTLPRTLQSHGGTHASRAGRSRGKHAAALAWVWLGQQSAVSKPEPRSVNLAWAQRLTHPDKVSGAGWSAANADLNRTRPWESTGPDLAKTHKSVVSGLSGKRLDWKERALQIAGLDFSLWNSGLNCSKHPKRQ